MTKEQILKKLIEKAVQGGWLYFKGVKKKELVEVVFDRHGMEHIDVILFDHSFAKAFWGEGIHCYRCNKGQSDKKMTIPKGFDFKVYTCKNCGRHWDGYDIISWKYHIKILSVSEDRLEYMKQFINGGKDERD